MVGERYLGFYRENKELDYTALRYGNVYGPRQDPNGEAGVISIFIGKFLARQAVRIDWDGEQTRDYVFVADVARANLAALECGSGEAYVIGTGTKTSVNDVYRALVKISGFEAPVRMPRAVRATRATRSSMLRGRKEPQVEARHQADRRHARDLRILQSPVSAYNAIQESLRTF